MLKATEVKTLASYKLWVKFADGVNGTVDLSGLAGDGVFAAWQKPGTFETVRIDPESGAIVWGSDIDLCPDALYLQITGKSVDEVFSRPLSKASNA